MIIHRRHQVKQPCFKIPAYIRRMATTACQHGNDEAYQLAVAMLKTEWLLFNSKR